MKPLNSNSLEQLEWKGLITTKLVSGQRVYNGNKKLSYRRDSAQCVKRSFKVTQGHPLLCQSMQHI